MNDLQKFCATEADPCPHIRKPTRCALGIVATNGHILICVHDDGRECEPTKYTIATRVAKFHGQMESDRRWFDVSSIALPQKVKCRHCNGRGLNFLLVCEDCDGEGEFDHGSHAYTCKECDGEGTLKKASGDLMGAKKEECPYCGGTGDGYQAVPLGGTHFQRRYLAMLADLPGCRIGVSDDVMGMTVYQFDGGWGALMPCLE